MNNPSDGTALNNPIDLFHAACTGISLFEGIVLTGVFSPDLTGAEFGIITADYFQLAPVPHDKGLLVLSGKNLMRLSIRCRQSPPQAGIESVKVIPPPELSMTTSPVDRVTVSCRRGFDFTLGFPGNGEWFDKVTDFLSHSLEDELLIKKADIDTGMVLVRNFLIS